jgi:DUF4097 and DUF4098 domain-containing protein YvlB
VIHETFTVGASPDIDVRIESGRVEIVEGEIGTVEVTVDTDDPGFIVEQRGNSILVSSSKNRPPLSRGSSFVSIKTPPGSDLEASVASAQVDCEVELGKVAIKTASGDITLDRATVASLKTASGDARLRGVGQALQYTSASGDLFVEDSCHGSASISTASGDVRITGCDAALVVNTVSGDVRLDHFSGRSATFKGMSGDVDLGIPRGTSVELDVNLLSGRLNLPEPSPNPGEPERHMDIAAKLVSGDLTISRL